MKLAGATDVHLVKGWFDQTLPRFTPPAPIALFRPDADWYDATLFCLEQLSPHLADGARIIIDDYYTWDGCARAVHDFAARQSRAVRLSQRDNAVCYLRWPAGGRA
jgi:hypothetical protein